MTSEFTRSLFRARFLFGTVPLFALATTALFPIVALELKRQGFDEDAIGAITSFYYLGAVIGAFTFGHVIARVGQKAAVTVAAIIAAATTLGLRLTDEPLLWMTLRFTTGYALGAYYLVMDSWVSSLATRSTRGRLYAFYETVRLVATALGPILLVLGPAHSNLLIVSALFTLSFGPALFNTETSAGAGKTLKLASLVTFTRCFPWALVIILCGGLSNSSFYALGAVYAEGIGLAPSAVAILVSMVLLAPALTGVPVGALADRYRRMRTAAFVSLIAVSTTLMLVLVTNPSPWLLGAGAFLVGGCMVTMYALGLSRIVDATGEDRAVDAATVGLLAYNLGSFLGPIISGTLMRSIGHDGLYVAIGLFALLAFAAAVLDAAWARCCREEPGYQGALS